jgi:hypothetical protein
MRLDFVSQLDWIQPAELAVIKEAGHLSGVSPNKFGTPDRCFSYDLGFANSIY